MYAKTLIPIFTAIVGTGGGLTGTYYYTQETIENTFKGKNVDLSKNNVGWTQLTKNINSNKQKLKSRFFQEKTIQEIQEQDLINVCSDGRKLNYKNLFGETVGLYHDFELFCTIKNSELINNKFTKENTEEMKSKLESLKNPKDSIKVNKNKRLNEIKNSIKGNLEGERSAASNDLLNWCLERYEDNFISEDDNWELVKEFCTKS